MALSFQDWSGIVPKAIMEKRYPPGTFPESGPFLIKVYASDQASWQELQKFATENNLPIDESRRVREQNQPVWKYDHIDLYADSLQFAPKEGVIPTDQVKELWFPSNAGENLG